jgi:hypothetical protein
MANMIHMLAVRLGDKYSVYVFFLMFSLFIFPGKQIFKFKYPDDKDNLSIEIQKLAIRLFWSSLPIGMSVGLLVFESSDSNSDLILLPVCGVGISVLVMILVPMSIFRSRHLYYKNKKK